MPHVSAFISDDQPFTLIFENGQELTGHFSPRKYTLAFVEDYGIEHMAYALAHYVTKWDLEGEWEEVNEKGKKEKKSGVIPITKDALRQQPVFLLNAIHTGLLEKMRPNLKKTTEESGSF
jgi:hypothetical protein